MASETTEKLEANQTSNGGVASLVGNILTDAQELTRQQIELFKVEIRDNSEKAKSIGILFALSLTLLAISGVLFGVAAAHFLQWAFPDTLHMSGAYAIVAGLLGVGAGILFGVCKQQLDSFSVLPEKAVEAMKENLEWKTKPN